MILIAGSNSYDLGLSIVDILKDKRAVTFTYVKREKFPNGELKIEINLEKNFSNQIICIIHSLHDHDDLIELLFIINKFQVTAPKITVILPYIFYARQDISLGLAKSNINLLLYLIQTAGANKVILVDPHNIMTLKGLKSIKYIKHQEIFKAIAQNLVKQLTSNTVPILIVSPDQGSYSRARELASAIGKIHNNIYLILMSKTRISEGIRGRDNCHTFVIEIERYIARRSSSKIESLAKIPNLSKGIGLIVDDIIDSGRTLSNAVNIIMRYRVNKIMAFITHPVLSYRNVRLVSEKSPIEFVFSNSTQADLRNKYCNYKINSSRIRFINLAPALAKRILNY